MTGRSDIRGWLSTSGHGLPGLSTVVAGEMPGRTGRAEHGWMTVGGQAGSPDTASSRTPATVLTTASAIGWLGEPAVRWRVGSGRWQRPCRGVLVTHSGPVSDEEALWIAVLAAGAQAVLGGLTAARLDGLSGFETQAVHLMVPACCRVRTPVPGVVVHRSRVLGADDVHPLRRPLRTRIARSLLDAAAWARSDDAARSVLAAGVQQRLTRADHLAMVLARFPTIRRHALLASTLSDIAGGAEALSELDFARLAAATACRSRIGRRCGWMARAGGAGWTRSGMRRGSWWRWTGCGTWRRRPGGRTCAGKMT